MSLWRQEASKGLSDVAYGAWEAKVERGPQHPEGRGARYAP